MTEDRVLVREEARSAAPNVIPGVVDGFVTTSFELDGSVSFHIVIGKYGAEVVGCHQIELILRSQHAEALSESLGREHPHYAASPRYEIGSVPCLVGVRLSLRGP
jgi:hypothetical protein